MATENIKEVTTKNGHKVVLKSFITYGEHRSLLAIYLNEAEDKAAVADKADRRGVEIGLVSIDGETENLYEKLSGMNVTDAQEIMKELEAVVSPKV